jgi:anti-sigma B factor antagonist
MKLSIDRDDGDVVLVNVVGDVTSRELSPISEPLGDLLGPSAYSRLVLLNLNEASYLDSSGVGWLLTCNKRFRNAGGKIVVHSLHPLVANVLKVLKLERVLTIADSAATGAVAVRGGAA